MEKLYNNMLKQQVFPQSYYFNNKFNDKKRVIIDTNALAKLVAIDKKCTPLLNEGYNIDDIKLEIVLNTGNQNKSDLNALFDLYKNIVYQKFKVVIAPTVIREIFNKENFEKSIYQKSGLNIFLHIYEVEHFSLTDVQKQLQKELVDILTDKKDKIFTLNKNEENAQDDAKIMVEAFFAGTDVFTFDHHFDNNEKIKDAFLKFINKKSKEGYYFPPNVRIPKAISIKQNSVNSFLDLDRSK